MIERFIAAIIASVFLVAGIWFFFRLYDGSTRCGAEAHARGMTLYTLKVSWKGEVTCQ